MENLFQMFWKSTQRCRSQCRDMIQQCQWHCWVMVLSYPEHLIFTDLAVFPGFSLNYLGEFTAVCENNLVPNQWPRGRYLMKNQKFWWKKYLMSSKISFELSRLEHKFLRHSYTGQYISDDKSNDQSSDERLMIVHVCLITFSKSSVYFITQVNNEN
jgi:hypothetical protein